MSPRSPEGLRGKALAMPCLIHRHPFYACIYARARHELVICIIYSYIQDNFLLKCLQDTFETVTENTPVCIRLHAHRPRDAQN